MGSYQNYPCRVMAVGLSLYMEDDLQPIKLRNSPQAQCLCTFDLVLDQWLRTLQ